jgi:uncharacterized RDD family membrane protein YckC
MLKRFGAFLADIMILDTIIMFPFTFVFAQFLPEKLTYQAIATYLQQNDNITAILIIIWTLYFFVMILYFSIFEYLIGTTPGKKVFDLNVVSEEGDLKYWQTIVRSLQLFVIVPLWIIDMIYLIFKKKRFFEAISKTKVVYKPIDF